MTTNILHSLQKAPVTVRDKGLIHSLLFAVIPPPNKEIDLGAAPGTKRMVDVQFCLASRKVVLVIEVADNIGIRNDELLATRCNIDLPDSIIAGSCGVYGPVK
jgi:hypothetical protein